jgi:hypothetical protein
VPAVKEPKVRVQSHVFRRAEIIGSDFKDFKSRSFKIASEFFLSEPILIKGERHPLAPAKPPVKVPQVIGDKPPNRVLDGDRDQEEAILLEDAAQFAKSALRSLLKMFDNAERDGCIEALIGELGMEYVVEKNGGGRVVCLCHRYSGARQINSGNVESFLLKVKHPPSKSTAGLQNSSLFRKMLQEEGQNRLVLAELKILRKAITCPTLAAGFDGL